MKRSAKLRPQMIGSATASTAQTAKSLLRWLRRVDRKIATELAAEHAAGTMSDHDVIRYIENEAHELLPDGFRLTCEQVYTKRLLTVVGDDGERREAPIGFAYFLDRDVDAKNSGMHLVDEEDAVEVARDRSRHRRVA